MGYVFSAYPCPSSSLRLSLSFLFPLPSSPPYLPLKVGPLKYSYGGLGERCKLFKRGLERSRSGNRILCILDLKSEIWCYRIYHFFLRINRPQCVKSAAKFGGLAGIWKPSHNLEGPVPKSATVTVPGEVQSTVMCVYVCPCSHITITHAQTKFF